MCFHFRSILLANFVTSVVKRLTRLKPLQLLRRMLPWTLRKKERVNLTGQGWKILFLKRLPLTTR